MSRDVAEQKHRIYSVNIIQQWKCICLKRNRGRRSEWRGQIFDRKLPKYPFPRMRSENMPKTRLYYCQTPQFYPFYYAIKVAEHDGDGSI